MPSRLYPGEFYALPQAPQQFKQLLMVGGVERYFQIAPCFRDEASRADRSPGEFYQIDLEMAFATQEDVFHEVELLFHLLVSSLSTKKAPSPYPRLSYADALARYGTDKPDLRFGLEIVDVTGALGGRTELPMFAEAPGRGNVVRALLAPGAAERPRSWFDAFGEAAKALGTIGSWLQLPADGSEYKGPLSRKLTAEEMGALVAATGAGHGDAVLTCVGPPPSASVALGQARAAPRPRPRPGRPRHPRLLLDRRFPHVRAQPRDGRMGFLAQPVLDAPGRPARRWRTTTRARSWLTSTTWCATGSSFPPGPSATTCPR